MVRPTAIRIHSEIRTPHLDTADFFMDDAHSTNQYFLTIA
jgi:hypothetical protein